jgi:hypothetical protein
MASLRETVKRAIPRQISTNLRAARLKLAAPPLETIALHDYDVAVDLGPSLRLSLVIPSADPNVAFGGVLTGIDIFLGLAKSTGADLRIIFDDFGSDQDLSIIRQRCNKFGLLDTDIEILCRTKQSPQLQVRRYDVFISFNWWITLNLQTVLRQQSVIFDQPLMPHIYILQEYEPFLYPFSSTHLMARHAIGTSAPQWVVINSHELADYVELQGHNFGRRFIFEPTLSDALRPYLALPKLPKKKKIIIYGRPSIPRNCYSALISGLREWALRYPEFHDWELLSVGLAHPPVKLAPGKVVRSLGKLSLDDYGALLGSAAVGVSLMSSPHPSYPPLEMAMFGLKTITNTYLKKDLSKSHENIRGIDNIAPETIAQALANVCREVALDPMSGWSARCKRESFLESGPSAVLDELSHELLELIRTTSI